MSVIRWQDPPPHYGHLGQAHEHQLIAATLKEHPQAWAVVAEGAGLQGLARQIKSGRISAYQPAGSFEAVTRSRAGVGHTIFARYVGEPS